MDASLASSGASQPRPSGKRRYKATKSTPRLYDGSALAMHPGQEARFQTQEQANAGEPTASPLLFTPMWQVSRVRVVLANVPGEKCPALATRIFRVTTSSWRAVSRVPVAAVKAATKPSCSPRARASTRRWRSGWKWTQVKKINTLY